MQYFDQRRENARTDWEADGIPRREWEDLLGEMRKRADKAGWLRLRCRRSSEVATAPTSTWPSFGNIWRTRDSGCTTTCRTSRPIVGKLPQVIMMDRFGTDAQKAEWTEALITGERSMASG